METSKKMKIFLMWADRGPEVDILIKKLEERSHRVLYWVGLGEDTDRHSDMIFHDHYAAWAGEPAPKVASGDWEPPSGDLVKKMLETESLVLTMMNKKFDIECVDQRRNLYYSMLGYWDGMIKKYKPDLIIFPIVPHTVYNYIVYALARLYGIQTIMFEDSWVSDRLIKYNDWREGSPALHEAIRKNSGKNFKLTDLSLDLQKYYELQTDVGKDATPFYTAHYKKHFGGF